MAKPDPALLDPARYPFAATLQTRFGDLDANGHVNSVALAGMFEDARVRLYTTLGYTAVTRGLATMVVSIGIEFIGQAFCPQPVDAHGAVTAIGRTSYTMAQLLRQDGRTVAFAKTVCVCVSGDRAAPLPPALVEALEAFAPQP